MPDVDQIEILSDRILAKELVFFVGAGLSIDSEGLSAYRLMIRLALRFKAMVDCLLERAAIEGHPLANFEDELGLFTQKLKRTFGLKHTCTTAFDCRNRCWDPMVTNQCDFNQLAIEYYAANDWFCAAFQRLLTIGGNLESDEQIEAFISDVSERESELNSDRIESQPLVPIEKRMFQWATQENGGKRNAGKALFLDTLGFSDEAVMSGKAMATGRELEKCFRDKLFPRHFVLARLAREGFCTTAITTNYDLLLEGAWKQTGFRFDRESEDELRTLMPSATVPLMARIASAHDFQSFAKSSDTSMIVKVHGCCETYRKIRNRSLENHSSDQPDLDWQEYMRAIVFTYREIQNWRSDSWSRDYLANLQRTRSVAFVGYSLQDPVIHDSFRTVYEHMAASKPFLDDNGQQDRQAATAAPAFFFGQTNKNSFHAEEILNAATHAIRADAGDPGRHENYISFEFRNRNDPQNGPFPNIDDLFQWTYHRVVRKYQLKCLKNDLRSIFSTLMARSIRPSELNRIVETFETMVENERLNLNRDRTDVRRRFVLQRTTAWTYYFHARLLREMAISDAIQNIGPNPLVEEIRDSQWYFPFTARPAWTAWGVVVELAIRRMFALAECDDNSFYPVAGVVPTVIFERQDRGKELLRLKVGRFDRPGHKGVHNYAVGMKTTWRLSDQMSPWVPTSKATDEPELKPKTTDYRKPFGRVSIPAPDAKTIVDLVLEQSASESVQSLLGVRS